MGEVYRARHVHLDEIRIIKVTKPDASGEGPQPRRFQEEARLATLVRHPNVAALYDFSRLPDGSFYMVWEFIDGVTLEEWLRRHGPLPPDAGARRRAAGPRRARRDPRAGDRPPRPLARQHHAPRDPGGRLQAKIIDLGIAKRVAAESLADDGHRALPRQAQVLLARAGRRARLRAKPSTPAATSTPSASCSTRCSPGSPRSSRRRPRATSASTSTRAPPPLDTSRLPREARRGAGRDRREGAREEPRPALPRRRGVSRLAPSSGGGRRGEPLPTDAARRAAAEARGGAPIARASLAVAAASCAPRPPARDRQPGGSIAPRRTPAPAARRLRPTAARPSS